MSAAPTFTALAAAGTLALGAAACAPSDALVEPTLSEPTFVVPGPGLPPEVEVGHANNNLDVVEHDGRIFFAFRAARAHFASPEARLYVLSSADQEEWRLETSVSLGTDVREPRLLSWNGGLWLYFAVLGSDPFAFEPQGMMVSAYEGPGAWSAPAWIYEQTFIPWRTKTVDGVPYMVGYRGGGAIYQGEDAPVEIHFLTTADGRSWQPVVPGQAVVQRGGGSETAFAVDVDGSLVAVTRNEEGDQLGWGSKICRAAPGDWGHWRCVADRKKYDSPLMFRHGDEIYLIGRRNISPTGDYDLDYDHLPPHEQTLAYQLDYWERRKRCALWRVDPRWRRVHFVLDLPSQGDTCFPGLVPIDEHHYLVYNYTTALDQPDSSWLEGQLAPTQIYRVVLSLP